MSFGPKNQAEANRWKYGGGAISRASYDPDRCAQSVHDGGRWPDFHQCRRNRGFGPDKLFCKIHDPEAIKAREEKSSQRYRKELDRITLPHEAVRLLHQSVKGITPAWLEKRDRLLEKLK